MKLSSFLATMGAGIAVGALGVMMLPKNGEAYKFTKDAAKTVGEIFHCILFYTLVTY